MYATTMSRDGGIMTGDLFPLTPTSFLGLARHGSICYPQSPGLEITMGEPNSNTIPFTSAVLGPNAGSVT